MVENNNIRIKKNLLNILDIPDKMYSMHSLRQFLITKLKKKKINEYFISPKLQLFLNESNNYINLTQFITTIVIFYAEYDNIDFFSYDQEPNYNNIKKIENIIY